MTQALLFEVGAERFGFPISAVRAVVRGVWPLRLPRPPFGCIGAVEVRGELLPLLDLGALLGVRRTLRAEEWAERLVQSHILIVESGGAVLALWVDQVRELTGEAEGEARCVVIDPDSLVGDGRRRLLARAVAHARTSVQDSGGSTHGAAGAGAAR